MKLRKSFPILNIFILLFTVLIGIYVLSNNLFNGQNGYSHIEFILVSVLYLLFGGLYLFLDRDNIKHNYIVIASLGLIFILDMIMSIIMKSPQDMMVLGLHGEYWMCHFEIDSFYRFQSIFRFFVILSNTYFVIYLFPQKLNNKGKLLTMFYIVTFVCTILILYSFIFEFNHYIDFFKFAFKGDPQGMFLSSPKSVFPNKNSFAFILFLNIVSLLLINHYTRRKWVYIFVAVSYFLILLTICKSIIILSFVLIFLYVIYRLVVTFKENKNRNITLISIIGGSILLIMICLFAITPLRNWIYSNLINVGDRTIEVREYIWSNARIILNGSGWFTGKGYGTFNALISVYNHSDPGGGEGFTTNAHNGYLEMLGEGGILYLLLAVIGQAYLIYQCVKNFKKDRDLSLFTLLLMTLLLIYMIFEVMVPTFTTTLEYLAMNALLFVPVLAMKYEKQEMLQKVRLSSKANIVFSIYVYVSTLVIVGLSSSMMMWNTNILRTLFIVLLSLLYVASICISCIFIKINKDYLKDVIVFNTILLLLIGLSILLSTIYTSVTMIVISIVLALFILLTVNMIFVKFPLARRIDECHEELNNRLLGLSYKISNKNNIDV